MLCEKCSKNEATIHYSEIINGKKKSYTLCGQCADEMGIGDVKSTFDAFGAGSLLSGFFGNTYPAGLGKKVRASAEKRCPVCSASIREIADAGKVGCAECYRTFREELSPTIRRIHGSVSYKGAAPETGSAPETEPKTEAVSEADTLRAELYEAIKTEDFERAAELRDRIRALEN